MFERKFKKVNRKAVKVVAGKVVNVTVAVLKEGVNGMGVTLPFFCGFCKDSGEPRAAFRTRRERSQHAQRCLA